MSSQRESMENEIARMPSSECDVHDRLQRFATLALDAMMEELRKVRGGYRLSENAMDEVLSACIDVVDAIRDGDVDFDQKARDAQVKALRAQAAANDPAFQALVKALVDGSPSSTG